MFRLLVLGAVQAAAALTCDKSGCNTIATDTTYSYSTAHVSTGAFSCRLQSLVLPSLSRR